MESVANGLWPQVNFCSAHIHGPGIQEVRLPLSVLGLWPASFPKKLVHYPKPCTTDKTVSFKTGLVHGPTPRAIPGAHVEARKSKDNLGESVLSNI